MANFSDFSLASPQSISVETHSVAETLAFVQTKIIPNIVFDDNIFLEGLLGAGKSLIARQILKSFKVTDIIPSPTFNLINTYQSKYQGRELLFYHIDFYRLTAPEQLDDLGIFEILNSPSLVLIEWGKQFEILHPQISKEIKIEFSKATDTESTFEENKRVIYWSVYPKQN